MSKRLAIYKIESPLHMGSGNEIGCIDMPIQREKVTGLPKVEASGIKGAMRSDFSNKPIYKNYANIIFGSDDEEVQQASSVMITDGKVLFFPVKSGKGIFCLVTCPFVLKRFLIDNDLFCKENISNLNELKFQSNDHKTIYTTNSCENVISNGKIIIDEFTFTRDKTKCGSVDKLLEVVGKNIRDEEMDEIIDLKKAVVISDEMFSYFTEFCSEIHTRVAIGNDGTVTAGPFTEEYLPAESIFYNFIEEKVKHEKSTEYFDNLKYVQLGGNATLGKGVVRAFISKISQEDKE